jgi:hypothetical protein
VLSPPGLQQLAPDVEALEGGGGRQPVSLGCCDEAEALFDLAVGEHQEAPSRPGDHVGDSAPVLFVRETLDEAAGHETVDDGGDGGAAQVEALGHGGRKSLALGQEREHAVLGKRQVDLGQGDLGVAG